jgi:uncharacterized protein (PEP-CTERM system associated)
MPRSASGSAPAPWRADGLPRTRPFACARFGALVVGLCAVQGPASAQQAPPTVTLDGRLSATDNGNLAASGERRADLIASARPGVRWVRRSPGLDIDVEAAATLLGHANQRHESAVLPEARAELSATLIEQWLAVDLSTRIAQTRQDAFGARADDSTSTTGRRTSGSYSIHPRLERLVAERTLLSAGYEARLTTNGASSGERATARRGAVRLERAPVPVGGWLEWSRLDTETADSPESRLTLQTARAAASVAVAHDWVFGVVAGQDRSRFFLGDHTDAIYGIDANWQPSPRTRATVSIEHRFFGVGGSVGVTHRSPFLALGLNLSRQPTMALTGSRAAGAGADLRSFLDAILTTRYPDATARDIAVDSLIRDHGLDTRLPAATDVAARYPQLQTQVDLNLTLLGRRNTANLSLYARTTRLLAHDGDAASPAALQTEDSRQLGTSLQLSHRLTPELAADAGASWSRIEGLAARAGETSSETVYRIALAQQLSAKSTASVGIQHNRFATTAAGQNPYRASSVFAGFSHRF